MTDRERWQAAWKELTLTTDPYPTWKRKGFPASSHWAKAKALGDQIGSIPPQGKVVLDEDFTTGSFTGTAWSKPPWLRTSYTGGKVDPVADPRGGSNRMLRLLTVAGDTSGPSGHAMAAFYAPNGSCGGEQGKTTLTEFDLYFAPDYVPAPGSEMPWLQENHISDAVPQNTGAGNPASCGLAIFSEPAPMFTYRREGGDPTDPNLGTWDNPQTGWWQAPMTPGLHRFALEHHWSVNADGYVKITWNGVVQTADTSKRFARLNGPTLFRRPDGTPDSVAVGVYNYGPGGLPESAVYVDSIRVTQL